MRSTRATYAVERLKTRSGNAGYAAVSLSGGLFYLIDRSAGKDPESGTRASANSNAGSDAGAGAGAGAGAAAKATASPAAGSPAKFCEPLPLDAFVAFVDGFGPPKPSKASKLDIAFEAQLRRSRS
jgi:hypothetical protein